MSKVIPEATKLAAHRAFVRTASQSLAMSLVLPAGVAFTFTQDALLSAAVGVGGMIVGAVVNGAQAYFSMIGKGIPDEYQGSSGVDSGLTDGGLHTNNDSTGR